MLSYLKIESAKTLGKQIHNSRYIYYPFALLDGINCSYSTFRYAFEVFTSSNDPNLLRECMKSLEGKCTLSVGISFLCFFSLLGAIYENKPQVEKSSVGDENVCPKQVNSSLENLGAFWPYLRHTLKGAKNGYRGWQNTVQAFNLFGGMDLKSSMVPLGLGLGFSSILIRCYMEYIKDKRKKKEQPNKNHLFSPSGMQKAQMESKNGGERQLTHPPPLKNDSLIEEYPQEIVTFNSMFLVSGLWGLLDGLYLYVGLLSLTVLPNPFFLIAALTTGVYIVLAVLSRCYEEYKGQLKQIRSLENYKKGNQPSQLKEITVIERNWGPVLEAIKTGLSAYGALGALLFTVSRVFLVVPPPLVLFLTIISGLIFIGSSLMFIAWEALVTQDENTQSLELRKNKAKSNDINGLIEASRSFFSGISKGYNFVSYLAPILNIYSLSSWWFVISGFLFSIVLGFRALARDFGSCDKESYGELDLADPLIEDKIQKDSLNSIPPEHEQEDLTQNEEVEISVEDRIQKNLTKKRSCSEVNLSTDRLSLGEPAFVATYINKTARSLCNLQENGSLEGNCSPNTILFILSLSNIASTPTTHTTPTPISTPPVSPRGHYFFSPSTAEAFHSPSSDFNQNSLTLRP